MKKYELTDETMKIGMTTLHRIKALAAFADVEIGDTGGWVEKESNLDQDGDAWVSGDAMVSGDAWVSGNAWVSDDKHYMVIGPIGPRDDSITFTRDKKGGIFATVRCFYGSLPEFWEKVMKRHGNTVHAQAYLLAAQLAELRIDTTHISDTQEEPTEGCEKGSVE